MKFNEALTKAAEIIQIAKVKDPPPVKNFNEYATLAAYAARSLSNRDRMAMPWLQDWAETWRALYDNFDKTICADPMLLYKPAHPVAEEFHSSQAFFRYFMAGNRTSKSQSGYAEQYFYLTGTHPYRYVPPGVHHTFLVAGLPFSTYAGKVFEAKLLTGEEGNELSPMFPIGGKWFYHYNERERELLIACPQCAEAGKAGSCKHPKSSLKLFSCEQGAEVLQGQAYILGHFDEDTPATFWNEGRQRLKTVRHSGAIATGTPLHGPDTWEQKQVIIWRNGPPENLIDEDDPKSLPLVSVHQISMWDAGLVPHSQIKMEMKLMDEFEVRARVYGEAVPLTDSPVFDRRKLAEIKARDVEAPMRGEIVPKSVIAPDGKPHNPALIELRPEAQFDVVQRLEGPLRIWEKPEKHGVYLIAVDVAAGMRDHDYSCAMVLKVGKCGAEPTIKVVAQWHGWINQLDFAAEVFKLGVWYNSALVAIELTGGYGRATMLKLKNELHYWNLHREQADYALVNPQLDARIGVDTTADSKALMISALQRFINSNTITCPCEATIAELVAFEQVTRNAQGNKLTTVKYRGASGSNDDRVMALAIGASIVVSSPILACAVQQAAVEATWKKEEPSKNMKEIYAWLKEDADAGAL